MPEEHSLELWPADILSIWGRSVSIIREGELGSIASTPSLRLDLLAASTFTPLGNSSSRIQAGSISWGNLGKKVCGMNHISGCYPCAPRHTWNSLSLFSITHSRFLSSLVSTSLGWVAYIVHWLRPSSLRGLSPWSLCSPRALRAFICQVGQEITKRCPSGSPVWQTLSPVPIVERQPCFLPTIRVNDPYQVMILLLACWPLDLKSPK